MKKTENDKVFSIDKMKDLMQKSIERIQREEEGTELFNIFIQEIKDSCQNANIFVRKQAIEAYQIIIYQLLEKIPQKQFSESKVIQFI